MPPAENKETDSDHTGHDGDDLLAAHNQVVSENTCDHYKADHHNGGDNLGRGARALTEFFDGA